MRDGRTCGVDGITATDEVEVYEECGLGPDMG